MRHINGVYVIERYLIEPGWVVKREFSEIDEVNVFLGDDGDEEGAVLRIQKEDGEWVARNLAIDDENRPLDADKFAEFYPYMVGPPEVLVEIPRNEDRDYTRWGIEDNGPSIEIRFRGTTERGTSFIDGVLFRMGDKTDDGRHYYATSASDAVINAVLKLDAKWTEMMYSLLEDTPYGDISGSVLGTNTKPTG